MSKHVLIAAAGTAGHMYPAQALAKELMEKKGYKVTFAGHNLSSNPYFDKENFFYFNAKSPSVCKNPFKFTLNLFVYLFGMFKTLSFLKKQKIELVVGFGSYHSFAALLASVFAKTPYVLFESNAKLGKVNQVFARKAKLLTYQLFDLAPVPGVNLQKVSMPFEKGRFSHMDKEEARKSYGLEKKLFTILVFGGSQGALSVNKLFLESLTKICTKTKNFQVIHLIGFNTDKAQAIKRYEELGLKAHVAVYEEKMSVAYSACDMVICRAGANSIYEQLYFKKPAIFIPYPFLPDKHQLYNARSVCRDYHAGITLEQSNLTKSSLAEKILSFMKKENLSFYEKKLQEMDPEKGQILLSELIASMCTKK
ncbi:hypothetical protein COB11_03875 [Candidatus Aerophobetes bacterium]|uniref:UDP-N-acetylglucosamine--N-acetylmuramyl-(pentapeptide) pyrophosphoryl-undecaprenol N-acetylglucosamine transferase n=1 Tax=Aerophobetes bacterium TaxID=2030807 RepID=A0A2A4YHV5_UNCAE|nr:MAG: hypothetical protein COB11_03875 [Candidatus Aerophobetes bacterium]